MYKRRFERTWRRPEDTWGDKREEMKKTKWRALCLQPSSFLIHTGAGFTRFTLVPSLCWAVDGESRSGSQIHKSHLCPSHCYGSKIHKIHTCAIVVLAMTLFERRKQVNSKDRDKKRELTLRWILPFVNASWIKVCALFFIWFSVVLLAEPRMVIYRSIVVPKFSLVSSLTLSFSLPNLLPCRDGLILAIKLK